MLLLAEALKRLGADHIRLGNRAARFETGTSHATAMFDDGAIATASPSDANRCNCWGVTSLIYLASIAPIGSSGRRDTRSPLP
jgi:hypothetical protein